MWSGGGSEWIVVGIYGRAPAETLREVLFVLGRPYMFTCRRLQARLSMVVFVQRMRFTLVLLHKHILVRYYFVLLRTPYLEHIVAALRS